MTRRLRRLVPIGPPSERRPSRPAATAGPAPEPMPGPLVLDLVAALVQGGAPPMAALDAVGTVLRDAGDPAGPHLLAVAGSLGRPEAAVIPGPAGVVAEALRLAVRAGLPPTALIRRAAAQERRRATAARSRAVGRLEVLLVLPAGLCLLPAFVLLGVAPVVLDLVLG